MIIHEQFQRNGQINQTTIYLFTSKRIGQLRYIVISYHNALARQSRIFITFVFIHSTQVMTICTRFDNCSFGKVKSGEWYQNKVASFGLNRAYMKNSELALYR